jgi:predicted alpha/beta-hydrolase family hydrolase
MVARCAGRRRAAASRMPQNPVLRRRFVGFALRWHALGCSRITTMEHLSTQRLRIGIDSALSVSALLRVPPVARAGYVFGHGAGAGMAHSFMAAFADGLAERGIATLRYQFPYMERGSKRPDTPKVAHAAVRAAVAEAAMRMPGLALFAGGKSFGGRMTSQAQALLPLPGVQGLVFVGFPLHPAGKPSDERAKHLFEVNCPMLFLQGTRDELASLDVLQPLLQRLGERATLRLFEDADHSFHVRARSGGSDAQTLDAMLDATVGWMRGKGAPGFDRLPL